MVSVEKCQLLLVVVAFGCGGAATTGQAPLQQQSSTPGSALAAGAGAPADQSNASSLVVQMSMVLPKKQAAAPAMTAPAFPQSQAGMAPGGAPAAPGAGAPPAAPGAGVPPATPGTSTAMVMTPPAAGAAGAAAPSGMTAAAGSGAANGNEPGADISGIPAAELGMLRELCVSEINRYRAMLTDKMLMPLKRATPAQEECSERGAMMDGDTMKGHGAFIAGLCQSQGFSGENSCPGYPVGGFGGGSTIADTFKACMQQMWAEGEPPVSRQQCQQDAAGCFEMHGHYLNMTDPSFGSVSCSFYKMKNGSYWMSQDFGYAGGGFPGWGMK